MQGSPSDGFVSSVATFSQTIVFSTTLLNTYPYVYSNEMFVCSTKMLMPCQQGLNVSYGCVLKRLSHPLKKILFRPRFDSTKR